MKSVLAPVFSGPAGESHWMRITGYLLLTAALTVFIALAGWILAGHPTPGWLSDSFFYLFLADFYSGSLGGSVPDISREYYLISRYPPLFPISLAAGHGGIANCAAAYYVTLGFATLSLVSTFLWLHQASGYRLVAGALIPLAVLSPQFFFLHLEILSESQFMFLVTVLLCFVNRCEQRRISILTVAAIACLVPLSRSAGFAMSIAVTLWIFYRNAHEKFRTKLIAMTVVWAIPAGWMLYRRLYPVFLDYLDDLGSTGAADWRTIIADIPAQLHRLLGGYAAWFGLTAEPVALICACTILFFAVVGWATRIRTLSVDAVFLAIYVGLVAIWPYTMETARLLSVTMPFVALHAWLGLRLFLQWLFMHANDARAAAGAAGLLLILTLIAAGAKWLDIGRRITAPIEPQLASASRSLSYFLSPIEGSRRSAESITRFVEMAREIPNVVSANDCVWTSFYLLTDFHASYRVRLKVTPKGIGSIEEARQKLNACRYVLVVDLRSPQLNAEPLYPAEFLLDAKPILLSREVDADGSNNRISAALLDLRN